MLIVEAYPALSTIPIAAGRRFLRRRIGTGLLPGCYLRNQLALVLVEGKR